MILGLGLGFKKCTGRESSYQRNRKTYRKIQKSQDLDIIMTYTMI